MSNLKDIYCFARLPENPEDFWELNVELAYINPFYEFKKQKDSAKIMTAIWMIYDPKSSLSNSSLGEEKLKEDIAKNFLNQKIKWSDYKKYIDAYKDNCRTKIEKELDDLYLMIKERQEMASDLDWESDFEKKDKVILSGNQYYENYFALRAKLKEEREEQLAYGKYTPSRLEARGQSNKKP